MDGETMNLFRRLGGDLFDVDPARRAHHQHGPLRRAIDDDPDVTLRRNRRRGSDEHFVNGEALDRHAENRSGVRLSFGRAVREPYPAGLTAPARMHLRLYDNLPPQALSPRASLPGRAPPSPPRPPNPLAPHNPPRPV